MVEEQERVVNLLIEVLPHLDQAISEHNDGHRLRERILDFLADAGYPGFREVRSRPAVVGPPPQEALPPYAPYRKVRQG